MFMEPTPLTEEPVAPGDPVDARMRRQMDASKDAVKEAVGAISRAREILERVYSDMDQFGDPPMADMER